MVFTKQIIARDTKSELLGNNVLLHSVLVCVPVLAPPFSAAFYSNASSNLAFILVFPPVGSAMVLLHTRQFTNVVAFPKIICSFLHFGHLILMNRDVGSLNFI